MAKHKRTVIGNLSKPDESKNKSGAKQSPYLKVKKGVVLKEGQIIKFESAKFQLESLEEAIKLGKLSEDVGGQIRERIQRIPEWVISEAILLEEK